MKSKLSSLALPILLCLSLGLAPFSPEPHLISKLRWIAGGAEGMEIVEWFDFIFHGFPWVYLFYKIFKK